MKKLCALLVILVLALGCLSLQPNPHCYIISRFEPCACQPCR